MSTFDFIADDEFRESLASDYRELETCVEHEAWKAAHVIAGGIVETLLVDYLLTAGQAGPIR